MPRRITPLSDTKLRTAKAAEKDTKLFDGGGLFILITPTGGKLWRLKYRFGGREKLLTLGTYPQTTLADARQKREEARTLLEKGIDPGATRKAQKKANNQELDTFEVIAREWHAKFAPTWADRHANKIIRRLELFAFPWLGKMPIRSITAPYLLTAIRRLEDKGTLDTAHRVKQNCGQVFRYAIATGRAERDPTPDLGEPSPLPTKNTMLRSPTLKKWHIFCEPLTATKEAMSPYAPYDWPHCFF